MFESKIIFISGASSGIGKGLSLQLCEKGAIVVGTDIIEPDFQHRNFTFKKLDVSSYKSFEFVLEEVVKEKGKIDFIFNNAGIGIMGEAQDFSIETWEKVIQTNLMGVINGTKIAYSIMLKQGFGHIVNTASLSGLMPFPTSVPYATTKHAIVGLSQSLRAEAKAYNIKVTAICPGFIATPIYENSIKMNISLEGALKTIPFKPMSLNKAIDKIISGVEKNKALVVFPFHAHFLRFIMRWMPRFFEKFILQKTVADFRKVKT